MSVRATFGFDLVGGTTGVTHGGGPYASGKDLMFDIRNGSWYNFSTDIAAGKPGPVGSGATGNAALKWLGTMFETRVFDPQDKWYIGLDWQRATHSGAGVNKWLYLSNPSNACIISVESQPSGTITIRAGGTPSNGSGTPLGTTIATYPMGAWAPFTEFCFEGFGGGVLTWSIYADDLLILTGTTSLVDIPDRITVTSQGDGGRLFDNVYFADGQGPAPWNTRLGPIRISTLAMAADGPGTWIGSPAGPPLWPNVADLLTDANGCPDGDFSYIRPNGASTQQLFQVTPSPCFGRVLGVSINICFNGTSGTTSVQGVLQTQSTTQQIGVPAQSPATQFPLDYHTMQGFQPVSIVTGSYFSDAEISTSLWGVSTIDLDARVTQIFLEKVTSLRSLPYDCGQNSYSF